MADSKEQLKRKNYFDLKRDEFMAMDEYLQSPISEIDLRNVSKAGGGMMNINDMIKPLSFAAGGPTPPDPDIYSSPKTGMETGETIGEIRARPKKPNEVDRAQIYQERGS